MIKNRSYYKSPNKMRSNPDFVFKTKIKNRPKNKRNNALPINNMKSSRSFKYPYRVIKVVPNKIRLDWKIPRNSKNGTARKIIEINPLYS